MDIDNTDPEYENHVRLHVEAIHCPNCGKVAKYMLIKPLRGSYFVAPVYACDTEGCPFSVEGEASWTPALIG